MFNNIENRVAEIKKLAFFEARLQKDASFEATLLQDTYLGEVERLLSEKVRYKLSSKELTAITAMPNASEIMAQFKVISKALLSLKENDSKEEFDKAVIAINKIDELTPSV
jgi:hypothetical protein